MDLIDPIIFFEDLGLNILLISNHVFPIDF